MVTADEATAQADTPYDSSLIENQSQEHHIYDSAPNTKQNSSSKKESIGKHSRSVYYDMRSNNNKLKQLQRQTNKALVMTHEQL